MLSLEYPITTNAVVPRVGTWIETVFNRTNTLSTGLSFPVWERGLKL